MQACTVLTPVQKVKFSHGSDFAVESAEYLLRPETVESLFVLYRVTQDATYRDMAWVRYWNVIVVFLSCVTSPTFVDFTAIVGLSRSINCRAAHFSCDKYDRSHSDR